MSAVTLHDVGFSYPGASAAALTGIELDVPRGQILGVVGPSGCGKSTLLKLVAGLLQPGRGQILLDGADATLQRPQDRQVGWVPQSYGLFDHLDVAGNIAFGLRARGVAKPQRAERVNEVLHLCRIADLADRPVGALSGGQRQRVAVARALAPGPRVLLFDEPLAALDPQLRSAIRVDLVSLLHQAEATALMVTHDQREAMAVADRVAVLRQGQLVQAATPPALWDRPSSAFVATFVAGAAVVPGQCDGHRTHLAPDLSVSSASGKQGTVGVCVRPGDLVVASPGATTKVVSAVYQGGHWLLQCRLPSGAVVPVQSVQRANAGQLVGVRPGTDVDGAEATPPLVDLDGGTTPFGPMQAAAALSAEHQ